MKGLKLIVFFFVFLSYSQETPPILNFLPEDYQSENQNWAITQDDNKFIFVANNKGLLTFDGGSWQLYPSKNNTIIRSLLADKKRIYSGAFMDFGYWEQNAYGALEYLSLAPLIKERFIEDENIWNIKKFDNWVLFQSFHRLYFYNTLNNTISFNTDFNNYYKIFEIDNEIYVYKKDGRLVKLVNDKEQLIANFTKDLNVKLVLNLFKTPNGFRALTRYNGFFNIKDTKITKLTTNDFSKIDNYQLFSGIQLKDGSYMLGSVSNGVIQVSKEGIILNIIDQTTGLTNNTVLHLYEDVDGNVWSALDNGVNCINAQSYITEFNDFNGKFGTTYYSITHKDKVYIGTNQGLFYKSLFNKEPLKKVANIEGQIWSLYTKNNTLFCGHTTGTFIIEDNRARQLTDFSGTWAFRSIPNQPHLLLQGHYAGLSVLEYNNGVWQLKNKLKGFDNSSRFFEVLNSGKIYINHEYKGVFELQIDSTYTKLLSAKLLNTIVKGKASSLVSFQKDLLYGLKDGVFRLNKKNNTFIKDTLFSQLFSKDNYVSGKLIADKKNRLWSFNTNAITYLEKGPVSSNYVIKQVPIPNALRKSTVSFENIANLGSNNYLVGKTNGYLVFNLNKKNAIDNRIYLNRVSVKTNDTLKIPLKNNLVLNYSENSLQFKFSTPVFNKYESVNYKYKLNDASWVSIGNTPQLTFNNLSYGSYSLTIMAEVSGKPSTNKIVYNFTIKSPLFLTTTAIVIYVLLLLVLIFVVNKQYKKYYRKQSKQLLQENLRQFEIEKIQADKEVIRLRNEKLSQEVESKNRELAISTMSIIKRNEFLNSIKKELKKTTDLDDKSSVYKLIDKNLNSTKDWNFFKEAFNNADKDFLKRAKKLHPDLTHNNLKFCAYLRLNLTSKEIAPLLNISVKSVEIRRYRLRKKLNLSSKTNLTDYILSI